MRIGFIGAGAVAQALSTLFVAAGHETQLSRRAPDAETTTFEAVSGWAEVAVVAIPFSAGADVLPPLAGALSDKVVIDATNPLSDDWSPLLLGQQNSAGEEIAKLLPTSRVVKAFNTVFADIMRAERLERAGRRATAFLASDDAAAAEMVAGLAQKIGFAPLMTGPLANARYLEALAHLNIAIAVGTGGGTNAAFLYDQQQSA